MVVTTIARGGCERRLIATAEGLRTRGHEVAVLVLGGPEHGPHTFEEEFGQFDTTFLGKLDPDGGATAGRFRTPTIYSVLLPEVQPFLPIGSHRLASAIARAIRDHRPEVVHTWGDMPAITAGVAACWLGVPRVILGQTAIAPINYCEADLSFLRTVYGAMLRNPKVTLFANSCAAASDYERWIGLPEGHVPVIYNGLLPRVVRAPTAFEIADYRAKLGFPPAAPVVGSIMRFESQKDPMLWQETAAEIARKRPDVRFLLVGYGSFRDKLISALSALGLEGRCVVHDPINDVGRAYGAIDVFLQTSHFEGLPNTFVEVQSIGRPIVATHYFGVGEAISEGVTGVVVPERSPAALARQVIQVLDDPDWARRALLDGPALVRRRFGHGRMIDELTGLYEGAHRPRSLRVSNGLPINHTAADDAPLASIALNSSTLQFVGGEPGLVMEQLCHGTAEVRAVAEDGDCAGAVRRGCRRPV